MKLTLLCNAGLALEAEEQIVLVDLPNEAVEPFYQLPDETWNQILNRTPPYDRVVGLYFTHTHPDHCDLGKVKAYHMRWPGIPVFLPEQHGKIGTIKLGVFRMSYTRLEHAPIEDPPVHVVTIVKAGERTIYLAADSKLDCDAHRQVLKGKKLDCAIWNSMFTSRSDTRKLLQEAADWNLIYHMPADHADAFGLWKKLNRNLERYGTELTNTTILDHYPYEIEL